MCKKCFYPNILHKIRLYVQIIENLLLISPNCVTFATVFNKIVRKE